VNASSEIFYEDKEGKTGKGKRETKGKEGVRWSLGMIKALRNDLKEGERPLSAVASYI